MDSSQFNEIVKFNSVKSCGFIKIGDTAGVVCETFVIKDFSSNPMGVFGIRVAIVSAAGRIGLGVCCKTRRAASRNGRNWRFLSLCWMPINILG